MSPGKRVDPWAASQPDPRPHLVPIPVEERIPPRPPIPWDDIRRMYVQGIACGPGFPDRTNILEALGEADVFAKSEARQQKYHRGAYSKISKVGKIRIVFPRITSVAKFFEAREKDVQQRARDEDWYGLQRLYRAQLRQKAGQVRGQERLLDVDKIDRQALAVAKMALKMIRQRLELLSNTVEVVEDGEGYGTARPSVDPRELESLGRSAAEWHALGRRALGYPVDKVGVMKTQDALALAEIGLEPVDGFMEDEGPEAIEALGLGEFGLGTGLMGDGRESVAAELGKDDAERLHGFLSVLGRAQAASGVSANGEAEATAEVTAGAGAPAAETG